jgi:hypothetical protein
MRLKPKISCIYNNRQLPADQQSRNQTAIILEKNLMNNVNQGLNPLRGSFCTCFIPAGSTRGYYCLIRQQRIKECPKDINNNSPVRSSGQRISWKQQPRSGVEL